MRFEVTLFTLWRGGDWPRALQSGDHNSGATTKCAGSAGNANDNLATITDFIF